MSILCAFNSCFFHQWKNVCELIWILSKAKLDLKKLTHQWKRFQWILINFLKQIRTHMIFFNWKLWKNNEHRKYSVFTDPNRARRRHIHDFRIPLDCTIKVKSRTPVNFQCWSVIPEALFYYSCRVQIEGKHLKP